VVGNKGQSRKQIKPEQYNNKMSSGYKCRFIYILFRLFT